jgi:hypothetical protein
MAVVLPLVTQSMAPDGTVRLRGCSVIFNGSDSFKPFYR